MKKTSLALSLILSACLMCPAFADFKEHFDLGQSYLAQYQYSGAINEFKSALRINYMDKSARIGLVNAYLARGTEYANKDRAWEKAADDYRSALFYLKYYPDDKDVRNSASAIDQIISNLDRCLRETGYDRTPQNRFNNAKRLRAEGNFPAAAYEFNHALGSRDLQKSSFEQTGDIMNILGNKKKAVEYYKKAVAVAPSDLNLRLTYAKALDDIENDEDALKEYSYVLSKANQSDKDILYMLERIFTKKLNENPTNANINANMGAVLQKENRLDEALSYYKKAESYDPSNINTRINVGTLYQQKGDYKTAIKAYESVLILYPDNVMANLYRAQCYEKLGDEKIAQDGYKKVLAVDPENEMIKKQMLNNVKKSMTPAQFVEYVKVNVPKKAQSDVIYEYAIELHKANQIDDAIYLYNETIALTDGNPSSEVFVNIALAQAQSLKYEDALNTLKSAQVKFPNDKSIETNLKNISGMRLNHQLDTAAVLYNNKQYDEAAKIYLSIVPPTVDTMIGAASSYNELGDKDKAIEYYKKALEMKKIDSDIAYYIAVLYGEKEDYENAKNYLGKAIAFNKNNKQAIEYLRSIDEMDMGNLLNAAIEKYDAGKYDEALIDFNKLISKNANNDYALYYRGMIYDSKGKHNEAISDLKKSYDLNKDFTICPYMIASNYDALKKYKEAMEYYQMYADSDVPDDDYKKYAKARAEELRENATDTAAKK